MTKKIDLDLDLFLKPTPIPLPTSHDKSSNSGPSLPADMPITLHLSPILCETAEVYQYCKLLLGV